MNKKFFALALVLLLSAGIGMYSFGIGLQFNANADNIFAGGPALTFKFDSIPFILALNWNIEEHVQVFGLTADYWIYNGTIVNIGSVPLKWFIGIGAFANMVFINSDDFQMNTGLRVPIGLNSFIGGNGIFEPFVQIAPSFGVRFIPSLATEKMFFPMSLGFRIWFR